MTARPCRMDARAWRSNGRGRHRLKQVARPVSSSTRGELRTFRLVAWAVTCVTAKHRIRAYCFLRDREDPPEPRRSPCHPCCKSPNFPWVHKSPRTSGGTSIPTRLLSAGRVRCCIPWTRLLHLILPSRLPRGFRHRCLQERLSQPALRSLMTLPRPRVWRSSRINSASEPIRVPTAASAGRISGESRTPRTTRFPVYSRYSTGSSRAPPRSG